MSQLLKAKGSTVFSIGPGERVLVAVKLKAEKSIGALLVMEGGQSAGIRSERDPASPDVAYHRGARNHEFKRAHRRPRAHRRGRHARMTAKRIRHLPVVDGGHVVGMLSIGDLVKPVIADQQAAIRRPESYIHA